MTQRRDRDQPVEVNPGIAKLEHYAAVSEANEIDLNRLVIEYQLLYPDKPVLHLAEDIQQQAAIYWNIIERATTERMTMSQPPAERQAGQDRLLQVAAQSEWLL
jgi:hypothetical protein